MQNYDDWAQDNDLLSEDSNSYNRQEKKRQQWFSEDHPLLDSDVDSTELYNVGSTGVFDSGVADRGILGYNPPRSR